MNNAKTSLQSEEVYHTVANDLYADTSASTNYDYPKCAPADSLDNETYTYVQTKQPNRDEASPNGTANTLITSK